MAPTLMAQKPRLARTIMVSTGHFRHIIHLGWVEIPLARTNFHGPKPMFEPLKFYCKCVSGKWNFR